MPAQSKKQFKFFKLLENDSQRRKEAGLSLKQVKEMTSGNKGKKTYAKLPEKVKK